MPSLTMPFDPGTVKLMPLAPEDCADTDFLKKPTGVYINLDPTSTIDVTRSLTGGIKLLNTVSADAKNMAKLGTDGKPYVAPVVGNTIFAPQFRTLTLVAGTFTALPILAIAEFPGAVASGKFTIPFDAWWSMDFTFVFHRNGQPGSGDDGANGELSIAIPTKTAQTIEFASRAVISGGTWQVYLSKHFVGWLPKGTVIGIRLRGQTTLTMMFPDLNKIVMSYHHN